MEEIPEMFKVKEILSGLQVKSGFRLFTLYFTDHKIYLIETDKTSGHRNLGWGFLQNTIRTRVISKEKQFEKFEKMKDTREIINNTNWFRTYPYENIVSMWIERGEKMNQLWFDIIQPEYRKKFGDEDGADSLFFPKERTNEYCSVLYKVLKDKFHGVKD